jgi:uncharacterized NAD(P)/FAD-binding protein YdhS
LNTALIEGSGQIARGVAFSTLESQHVLNVRAEGMSAWSGEPEHFARRARSEGVGPRDFAARSLFGRYLGEILDEAIAGGNVAVRAAKAIGVARLADGWQVALADGSAVQARALILATGNHEPEPPGAFADAGRRFIANPWGDQANAAIQDLAASGGPVLILGTGLTMVDVALSLEASGYRGGITALSRRGLTPRAHASFTAAPIDGETLPAGLIAMTRWLRRRSADVGWRAAVDSLRPHSHQIWQGLSTDEQRRFQRHARPWWDVHRHRIAPQVADVLARMIADGQLMIMAGNVAAVRERPDGLDIDVRGRGEATTHRLGVDYAVNCTGPLHAIARSKDPLLRGLLKAKEVHADPLGIGLEVDEHNRAGSRLWALGALTKGRYWEIIAVPDIREQAAAVAGDIQRELCA